MSLRRPWEEPIVYNEDRLPDQPSRRLDDEVGGFIIKPDPDLVVSRIREVQQRGPVTSGPARPKPAPNVPRGPIDSGPRSSGNPRPSWRDGIANRSNDDTPLNYGRGRTTANSTWTIATKLNDHE